MVYYGNGEKNYWANPPSNWSESLRNKGTANMHKVATNTMMPTVTAEDIMAEFRLNGTDSPYEPEEQMEMDNSFSDMPAGSGQSFTYLRQKSCPEPERTPIQKLNKIQHNEYMAPTNNHDIMQLYDCLTEEQARVLRTLPDKVLKALLLCLENDRSQNLPKENVKDVMWSSERGTFSQYCRFCKKNGEREAYVRSHTLKDCSGRVSCPVLRHFVCTRCGATGDNAHTIKYCPYSSVEERNKSKAIMRSIRMASGRRRASSMSTPSALDYAIFGQPSATVQNSYSHNHMPLDPMWAALERKLSM